LEEKTLNFLDEYISMIEDQYLSMKYGTKSPDDAINVPWLNSNMRVAIGCPSLENYSLYLVMSVLEPSPPLECSSFMEIKKAFSPLCNPRFSHPGVFIKPEQP
jgi:hypothetical protein